MILQSSKCATIHITNPEMIGIVRLSLMPRETNSTIVAVNAPATAIIGLSLCANATSKQTEKQARLPSRLLGGSILILPHLIPTNAAKKSPKMRKYEHTIACLFSNKMMLKSAPKRKYPVPVTSSRSCPRNKLENSRQKKLLNFGLTNRSNSHRKINAVTEPKMIIPVFLPTK